MFHARGLNKRIKSMHYRALRLTYKEYTGSSDELLSKDNSFRIHQGNPQKLAVEIFKVKLDSAPGNMKDIFQIIENPLNQEFKPKFSQEMSALLDVIGTASFGAAFLKKEYKECNSVHKLKAKIKFWYPEQCPCQICKNYIYQIDYKWVKLPVGHSHHYYLKVGIS